MDKDTESNKNKDLKRAFERAASFHPNFFPAEIGIDAQKYFQSEPASYAGVSFFPEQGWIHGVHAQVTPASNAGVVVKVEHWVHRPDGDNVLTPFMELHAQQETDAEGFPAVVVKKVVVQGEDLNVGDRKTLDSAVATCREIMEQLRLEGSMPALNIVAERNGLKTKALPSTYKDGNARFAYESGEKKARRFLRVPEKFLSALTGFNEEGERAKPNIPVLFNATQDDPDSDTAKSYTLYAEMLKGGDEDPTMVSLRLARKQKAKSADDDPYNIHRVAKLAFKPCTKAENKGLTELREIQLDGRMVSLSDHLNAVRALNFVHDSVVRTQAGLMPDMNEIISETGLQTAVSGTPELSRKDGQRYTFRVLGGTPSGPRLFSQDNSIGANSFLHLYEWYDQKGKYNSEAVMVDCGITPLSRDKTGFDGMMTYAGEYFEHRTNKKHRPKHKVSAMVVTHHHIDHYLGLVHLLSAGYKVDHIICNAATRMYIEKECKALQVPREFMPKKWTVIGADTDLKIGKFDLSFGWIPHSAITNWVNVKTPEGSTFHFSDAKTDPEVQSHPGADVARIAAQKPTMAILDSTRANQEDETTSEKDLEDQVVDFLSENPDKGVIAFHISTNAARMTTMVNAFGRTGRNTAVLGASKQFLKKVLDTVGLRSGFGLKAHASKEFGTKIVNFTPNSKSARAIVDGPLGEQAILATGTHNEPMSIINRLIENKDRKRLGFITPDKYVVVLAQEGIGENNYKFKQVTDWLERRGFQYRIIHASGHEGKKGIQKMLGWVKAPFGVATHGNAKQRADSEKILSEMKVGAINPAEQDVVQVSDKKGCAVVAQDPSTMIYFSVKREQGKYYGGAEDVEYYGYRVLPEMRTPVGEMLRDISRIKREDVRRPHYKERHLHNLLSRDPLLSGEGTQVKPFQKRLDVSLPDYLIGHGILRRVVYDCETTQLGRYAWITQFAAKQSSWDGQEKPKYLNIRQTLPRTILPDLGALLATGVRPAELYKTGGNYHTPRRFYHEIVKFLSESRMVGPEDQTRIWLDRAQEPKDPHSSDSKDGSDPYLKRTLDYALSKSEDFEDPRSINVRTLVGGYNNTRSDDVWLSHAAFRAGAVQYFPVRAKGLSRFDLRNMARIFAYLRPDAFKAQESKANPGFLDFSVKGVIEANNLTYDSKGAHAADADVEMEDAAILEFMIKTDAELFTRMVLNTSDTEVKKFLAGTHNGMLYSRSLVTYINNAAAGARANIGVYVGRSTDPVHKNKALLFNVSDFDPRDFEDMSAQEIAEIMRSPKHKLHKAFEIVQINKQPLLAAADRGFAVNANRGSSVESLKRSKHFIEANPKLAAKMIRAMEVAKFMPEPENNMPMEERIFSKRFMTMSKDDESLAKLFEPSDVREFTDEKFADELNRERARALDKFHSIQVRERYVAVMYQVERECQELFGKEKKYLHPQDRAREKAKEKARIHGLIDTSSGFDSGAISLGTLEAQIKRAHNKDEWEKMMAGKDADKRKLAEQILKDTEALVQEIKVKIANNDPDWVLTNEDYALLGLDDNVPYGRYRAPVAQNPELDQKAPEKKVPAKKSAGGKKAATPKTRKPANDNSKKPAVKKTPKRRPRGPSPG